MLDAKQIKMRELQINSDVAGCCGIFLEEEMEAGVGIEPAYTDLQSAA